MVTVFALFTGVFIIAVSFYLFGFYKEAKRKLQIEDYKKNANDWILNDYASNNKYNFSYTRGIKAFEEDGKIKLVSQSKLTGSAIN